MIYFCVFAEIFYVEISLLPICKDISLSACAFLYLLSVSLCRLDRAMPSFDSSVLSLTLEAFPGGTEFILGGGGGGPIFQSR